MTKCRCRSEDTNATIERFITKYPVVRSATWDGATLRFVLTDSDDVRRIADVPNTNILLFGIPRASCVPIEYGKLKRALIELRDALLQLDRASCACGTLLEYLGNHCATNEFSPYAYYNRDGDQLEIYWSDQSCFGTELKDEFGDPNMCLMSEHDDKHKHVGVTIYNLKKILKKAGYTIIRRNSS